MLSRCRSVFRVLKASFDWLNGSGVEHINSPRKNLFSQEGLWDLRCPQSREWESTSDTSGDDADVSSGLFTILTPIRRPPITYYRRETC